jgi:hypothetical protein
MAAKVAALVLIIALSVSGAAAYYITTQETASNSATPTPQPTTTPTSTPQPTTQPEQTQSPQQTPTQTKVTFNYYETNRTYSDQNTTITLKIAFDTTYFGVRSEYFYLIAINHPYLPNGTQISWKTIDRSWSGYPLTVDFVIDGHYSGDFELRYGGSNTAFMHGNSTATFLYNKAPV